MTIQLYQHPRDVEVKTQCRNPHLHQNNLQDGILLIDGLDRSTRVFSNIVVLPLKDRTDWKLSCSQRYPPSEALPIVCCPIITMFGWRINNDSITNKRVEKLDHEQYMSRGFPVYDASKISNQAVREPHFSHYHISQVNF